MRTVAIVLTAALVIVGCTGSDEESEASPVGGRPLTSGDDQVVDRAVAETAQFISEPMNDLDPAVFAELATVDDPRAGWIMVDLGQFVFRGEPVDGLIAAAGNLADDEFTVRTWWKGLGDHLITEDVAAPAGLVEWKQRLYGAADTTFVRLVDAEADVDWRHVSFGGVLPDTRPAGSEETCFCIEALDDPPWVEAVDATWYPDHRLVFGIEVDGEYRAYPINIMEIHELVNDSLGGRPISLTYCTLCRSAVAYVLDELPAGVERPVLRTSGLLQRSNKLVYDLTTFSLIDQFTGEALSGPLAEASVVLPRVTVTTSRWDEWRAAHPETTLMAGKGGNGENYPFDTLIERDSAGPIFPIGDFADDLRAIQRVIGTLAADGAPVAFSIDDLQGEAESGRTVTHRGVTAMLDGSGFRLVDAEGRDLRSSEANWFAWIQRFPDTDLWTR